MLVRRSPRLPFARLPIAIFLALAALSGCARPPGGPPGKPPPPGVTATKPALYPVQAYYEYNGYLDAIESVEIRARVKGVLTDVYFKEGAEVAVDDKLYRIDQREYAASLAKSEADIAKSVADIANAKAQILLAETDYNRTASLSGGGAMTKSDLEKATATLAANRAQLDASVANKASAEASRDTAKLQLEYTLIKAPIPGRINRTLVTAGNLVGQTDATLLTTIVGVDKLYVYFDAPEKDFLEYQRALQAQAAALHAAAKFPVSVGVATEEGFPHVGTIDFQENRVDTGTGTIRVRGRLDNPVVPPGGLRLLYPGLYVRVRVPNGPRVPQLVIPEEALMTGQEGKYVYVVGKDNLVQKRTVTLGVNVWRAKEGGSIAPTEWLLNNANPKPPAGPPGGGPPGAGPPPGPPPEPPPTTVSARSIVAIAKGLEAGDIVIVKGLQTARPGAPVNPTVWDLKPPQ